MDPGYVWDLDVGLLAPEYRRDDNTLCCTHVACRNLRFDTQEQLALHWNRFHVAAVPVFKCPDPGCEVQTTVCTVFYSHWTDEHSLMRLDGPMLDQIVGLAVNPYYCHNAARDVPGETATRPMLVQAMGRSPFDAGVQRAFRDHVQQLQQLCSDLHSC